MMKQHNHVGVISKEVTIQFENGYSLTLEANKEISLSVVENINTTTELLPNESLPLFSKVVNELNDDLKNGFICPKCHNNTDTYRRPFAKRWCPKCGYVLRYEGDTTPYNYLEHIEV